MEIPMEKRAYSELGLLEFQEKFATEEACRKHLIELRWPEGFKCRHCGKGERHCFKPSRLLFECYDCKGLTSVTAQTLFHKSKVPLRKWFWCVYFLATSKKAISTLYLSKQLKLNYKTAWAMRRKIQTAMANRDEQYRLKGIVEVDEIWIGGKQTFEKRREFGPNKTPFFIAVEEDKIGTPRFARAQELQSGYDGNEIYEAAKESIPNPSVVKSDGHGAYRKLPEDGHVLEHSIQSKNPDSTAEHLKWINIITSNLKRYLLSTHHGVFPAYRAGYVSEFLYRFNRRFWPGQAFDRLLFANIFKGPTPLRV